MTGTTNGALPKFLDPTVEIDGVTYELLDPITELRSCHDGTPAESRILFICRQTAPEGKAEEAVLKVKVQYVSLWKRCKPRPLTAGPEYRAVIVAHPTTRSLDLALRQPRSSKS